MQVLQFGLQIAASGLEKNDFHIGVFAFVSTLALS